MGVTGKILEYANEDKDMLLAQLVAAVANQSKYDEDEDAIVNIFDEVKGMLDEYQGSLGPGVSAEEKLDYFRLK